MNLNAIRIALLGVALGAVPNHSQAAPVIGINGGVSVASPDAAGEESNSAETGYNVGLLFDHAFEHQLVGVGIGYQKYSGNYSYPPAGYSLDYTVTSLSLILNMKYIVAGGGKVLPYIVGGFGGWRFSMGDTFYDLGPAPSPPIERTHIRVRPGLEAGAGILIRIGDTQALGVEALFHYLPDDQDGGRYGRNDTVVLRAQLLKGRITN